MATNNVSSMCSLIDNLVTMPHDKKVQLLPQEREILVKGLDDIFETLCEYKSRCDELYEGVGNASSDEIILEIEPEENEDCEYVEDDDSEDEIILEIEPEENEDCEYVEDDDSEDEYCIGCETGADCSGAHSDKCNMIRGYSKYTNMVSFCKYKVR